MRILIANPFGIGDVLFSLPFLYALRERDPKGYIGYLCNRRTEELVTSSFPIDMHWTFEKDEWRVLWRRSKKKALQQLIQFPKAIQKERFEFFVDFSLGWHYGLGALLAGIPRRIGFDFRGRGRFLTEKLPLAGFHEKPVAEYLLDLLPFLGLSRPQQIRTDLSLPKEAQEEAGRTLSSLGISPTRPFVCIVPGGGASWGPNAIFKQWAPEQFAQAADRIADHFKAQILIIGDESEAPLCEKVRSLMREKASCATPIPKLLLLAGIFKKADLLLGNDSGPMHLGAAVATKTVTIFGPVDARVYGPYSASLNGFLHRTVTKGLACRPCYQGFRFPPCPWNNACLKHLSNEEVFDVVRKCWEVPPP